MKIKPMKISNILVVTTCLMLFTSCAMQKQLQTHKSEIERISSEELAPKEKYDALAEELIDVIDESLRYIPPEKTNRYLETYVNRYDSELDGVNLELKEWWADKTTAERIAFGARSASKSYTLRLFNIHRKLKKRLEHKDLVVNSKLSQLIDLYRFKKTEDAP